VGRGATFTIRVPLRAPCADVGDGGEPAREASHARLHGERVLVVEDDADSREVLAGALETCGAEVRAVGSAQEALDTLDGWAPDVLLSDIALPDQDGYALLRAIRQRTPVRGAWVPAAAVTAYASTEDVRRAMAAGYQVHLPKPLDLQRVVRVVEDLAAWSRRP
jgi:CheY-like chemotaxis protein